MNEIWKDIKGYEGIYQVSNFGRVKSLSRYRRISECCKGKKKYCRLKDGTKLVWSFFYEENEVV